MSTLERFFHGEHGAARSYLFSKVFLVVLALDAWMLMIGHAGRYGVADFNVAHFLWLDVLQPLPSATLYIAVLLGAGLLSLTLALTGLHRGALVLLFLLYTYSWTMSMLDSYQHHYFVSLILACLIFFPRTRAQELHPLPPPPPESESARKKQARDQARIVQVEVRGHVYSVLVLGLLTAVLFAVQVEGHVFRTAFLFGSALALLTWLLAPSRKVAPTLATGFGFNLLGAVVCIVYLYTAIAKMDSSWLAGHTIRAIGRTERGFAPLVELAGSFGIEPDQFWSLFSTFVIPQELFMGFAYLVAVVQDAHGQTRATGFSRAVRLIAFLFALGLHVGAEAMGLEIGWFSAYMLLFAVCYLLPLSAVDRLAMAFSWPARFFGKHLDEWEQSSPSPVVALMTVVGAAGLLAVVGTRIDLPGADLACDAAAAALCAAAIYALVRRAADPRRWGACALIAAGLCWMSIAGSPVRWDFYRYLGGDMQRRGEPEKALAAYERGERYAPKGESRRDKIVALRKQLGRE